MGIPIRHYWRLLVGYLRPQWRRVAALTVLLLTSISLQLLNPQLLGAFVDGATAGRPQEELTRIALTYIGIALLNQLCSVLATYFSENVGWTATNALRADLARHCLNLDLAFHKARTPGELIERIDGDVTALANFFSQFVVQVLGNLLLLVGVLLILFGVDWRVGLALTAFSAVVLVALTMTHSFAVPYWTAARQSSADLFGFIEERLAGTEDIRSNGAAGYMMARLYDFMRRRLEVERKAAVVGGLVWTVPVGLFSLRYLGSFAITAFLFTSRT